MKSEDLIGIYRRSNRAEDFEQIVRRFAALVLCECRRVTGNVYDAEDASQLVFLALAMEIKSGTDIQQLGAWLKRVSRRQALKIVRSRTRRKRREDAVRRSELHLADTDYPLDQAVIGGIIRDAIDQLPERYRLAVILHYFGGMTLELIAVELKISKQAVGTRLHRGRKMLGQKLARQGVRLDEGALAGALAVLVPATVVSAVVKAATGQGGTLWHHSAVAAAIPSSMTHLLNVISAASSQRQLRLATLAAAMMIGGSGLAMMADPNLHALRQIAPSAIVGWVRRSIENHLPRFKSTPILPTSNADDIREIKWIPIVPHLTFDEPAFTLPDESPRGSNGWGSNGPLAYGGQSFGIPHSQALAAPITRSPAEIFASSSAKTQMQPVLPEMAPMPRASGGTRDWTSSEPMRLAIGPQDSEELKLDPGVHHAASMDVGVAGNASIAMGPLVTFDADEIQLGFQHGGSGAMVNDGGRVNSNRMVVGSAGTGVYHQRAGQLNLGQLIIAAQPQSQGEMLIDSGNVELTTAAGLTVGAQGSGKLILGSADAPASIHAASALNVPVIVRATPAAKGLIQGWGTLGTGGTLINNGRIVADGDGQIRTLNLTNFASVENTIDNPPNGTNGWYAQNGGSLQLPPVQIHTGTGAYTWGESADDPTLDLVNSLRITVHNQPQPTALSITLTSIDAGARTITAAPLTALPNGVALLSLYHIVSAFSPFTFAQADVTARYAVTFTDSADGIENGLQLYAYDGRWYSAGSIEVDSLNKVITGSLSGEVNYLAVGLPAQPVFLEPHTTIGVSTIAGLNSSADAIPEPCGAILLALAGIGFIRPRRLR